MRTTNRKTDSLALDEYDWAELFAQFRDNPNEEHVARVRRILELLKALTPGAKGRPGVRVFSELNARVSKYQWHSHVSPSTQGVMEFLQSPMDKTGMEKWEYAAVRWLLDLFRRHGELDRVHLCEMHGKRAECAGWFYGRPNKPFCSSLCKQYRYDSQEEVKARRVRNAKHNRDYRANIKRQEEREKKRVGYKGDFRFRAEKGPRSEAKITRKSAQ
jgi:hypothetical protein